MVIFATMGIWGLPWIPAFERVKNIGEEAVAGQIQG